MFRRASASSNRTTERKTFLSTSPLSSNRGLQDSMTGRSWPMRSEPGGDQDSCQPSISKLYERRGHGATQIERTSALLFGSNGGGQESPAGIGYEPARTQAIRPVGSAVAFSPCDRRFPIVGDRDQISGHLILVDVEDSISRVGGARLLTHEDRCPDRRRTGNQRCPDSGSLGRRAIG